MNVGWSGGFLNEEEYQWVRVVGLLGGEEYMLPFAVRLDLNTPFLEASARLTVGLSAPERFRAPVFDPKVTGSWLVDLSRIELDARLLSPFTPAGTRPVRPGTRRIPSPSRRNSAMRFVRWRRICGGNRCVPGSVARPFE
ncbi:hypothetical protein [Streptomyces liangshanensis]|uniref:hypothetical protein n=1 Tax=Streptomyces liangshanensis TaxID=2717324 RepID=UPI0036DF1DB2